MSYATNLLYQDFFIHMDEYKIKNFCGEEGKSMVKRIKKALFLVILAFILIITMHPLEAKAGEWTVDGDVKDYVYISGDTYGDGSQKMIMVEPGSVFKLIDKEYVL